MNANANTNRNHNYTKLQCYPSTFLGINTYTNTRFVASNNNADTVSPAALPALAELTLTSQILEYNKICKKFNGTI